MISFHHYIAISSYQLGEKAENERYATLKGLKMKDICQNKEIKKYPYINLISFPHSIAISFYQLCEKSRKWKIHNFKRTENEGYSPEQKMKNICIRKWKIYKGHKMKNIHLVICNFFFLISWKGTRWKIHNLKRTENEGNSPEQKKKNINIVIWYASLVRSTKNEGRSWEFF